MVGGRIPVQRNRDKFLLLPPVSVYRIGRVTTPVKGGTHEGPESAPTLRLEVRVEEGQRPGVERVIILSPRRG